ncbi:TPA: hypothetical protein SFZ49_001882, partial [Campylobacter jejuni]|nr:hypothetical protein [Campylobacter jejuni]
MNLGQVAQKEVVSKVDSSVQSYGTQTVGGKKNFTVAPSAPAPSEATDLVNKQYVDNLTNKFKIEIESKFNGLGFSDLQGRIINVSMYDWLLQNGWNTSPSIFGGRWSTGSFSFEFVTPSTGCFVYCPGFLLEGGELGRGGKQYYGLVAKIKREDGTVITRTSALRDFLLPNTRY